MQVSNTATPSTRKGSAVTLIQPGFGTSLLLTAILLLPCFISELKL